MLATQLSDATPRTRSNPMPRRKGPPSHLRIHTPTQNSNASFALVFDQNSAASSTLSSATSETDPSLPYSQFIDKPKSRSMKNAKNLTLALPPSQLNTSSHSLAWPSESESTSTVDAPSAPSAPDRKRRPSTLSLPTSTTTASTVSRLQRKDEDDSPSPYVDGPVQILPGIWLGSEDNARDWKTLVSRGIRSILNVAKEVTTPFDALLSSQPLRSVASTPDLAERCREGDSTFYPAHGPSGRPAMHYLKLPWSHGQPDLVNVGFVRAMEYIDAAVGRGDGVLIHCQCGVSRSATVVIALVMRAAALSSPSVPPEVWALKDQGMHGAYSYVKDRSSCIGPNMSLIYQLLEYEHKLQRVNSSASVSGRSSAIAEEEEEWSRQRQMMEDDATSTTDVDRESVEVMREARALDKAMEDRIVARKASSSSTGSSSGGLGMGSAWKSRYGCRARTGSIASNFTNGSILSEDLVEENEEQDLLGVGGGFDCPSLSTRSPSEETTEDSRAPSVIESSDRVASTSELASPLTARPELDTHAGLPPPSAPATKTSFGFTPRLPFRFRTKRRQASLGILPPVPSSPVVAVPPPAPAAPPTSEARKQREAKRVPPPLRLESTTHGRTASLSSQSSLRTASQTLFLFPPSPTFTTQTPSTVTVTSSMNVPPRHAALCTPRVSSFNLNGRRRSFIGLGVPPTPTTACSRVDVRGWVGYGPN